MNAQPAKEFPDSLDVVEFGAVWRKIVKVQRPWADCGVMVTGVVSSEDGTAAAIPVADQVLEEAAKLSALKGEAVMVTSFPERICTAPV